MTKKLLVSDGQRERQLLLVANVVVGRDPICDISDPNSLLSRRHAEFVVRDSEVRVRDLGSRNGVYVNGTKTAEERLRSGDLVRIGHLELRYLEDETPLSSALAAAAADATGVIQSGPALRPLQPTASAVRPPVTNAAPPSPPAPVVQSDEEERTRMVRPPSAPTPPAPKPPTSSTRPAAPPVAADEEERTRLVRPPVTASAPPPVPLIPTPSALSSPTPAAATATPDADEEERTRLVRPPARPAAPTIANLDDDEQTRLVRPQGAKPSVTSSPTLMVAASAIEPPAAPAAPPASAAAAQPATASAQTTFVFVYSGVLAVIVAVATAALLLAGRGSGTEGPGAVTIGGVVVVVVVATIAVGAMLAARVREAVGGSDRGRG